MRTFPEAATKLLSGYREYLEVEMELRNLLPRRALENAISANQRTSPPGSLRVQRAACT
jgi:hypothetical protein